MSTWESRLRAVRRHLLLRGAVEEGAGIAAVIAGLWSVGNLAYRLLTGFPPPLSGAWTWAGGLLAGVPVLLVRLRHRFRLAAAAEASDRLLQSHDLMATALWLRGQRPLPPSGAVVLRRAEEAATRLQPRQASGRPAGQVILPRLAALVAAVALGLWASVAPLPVLRTAMRPTSQGTPPAPSWMPPAAEEPSPEEESSSGLSDALRRLEEELAGGEASPQGARETLDRLLRGLDTTEPGAGPRSPLSPAEQEELEALLERIIGRAGTATGLRGDQRAADGSEDGEAAPSEEGGRGSGRSDPEGPRPPALDPGTTPERPGSGADGPADSPGQPGRADGPDPRERGPVDDLTPNGGGSDVTRPGTGPAPGLDPGDPVEGPGFLPPPAATAGEPDLLPSTPGIGPYGLAEGPGVTPAPVEDPGASTAETPGSAPDTDPSESPVLQPLLPALYREWLQRYFTPGAS